MRRALLALALAGALLAPLAEATRWKPTSPVEDSLRDVLFADPGFGLAVGSGLTILRTTDGGIHWDTPMSGFFASWFAAAWGGPGEAWAAGSNTIFQPLVGHSTDGGQTWTRQSFYIDNNEATLLGIATRAGDVLAAARIWDGQGAVVRSTDGGATWPTALWVPETLRGIDAEGATVVAVGEAVYASADGGSTWQRASVPPGRVLLDVDLRSPLEGVAVGEGGTILRTADGGGTWTEAASGTTADLHGVRFTGAMGHAAGSAGTMLRSDDGGAAWEAEDAGTEATLWAVDQQPGAAPFGRAWYAGDGVLGMGWDLPPPHQRPVSR